MVTALALMLLLAVKHLIISNVIDFGYSRSRDTRNDYWWLAFAGWISLELVVTDVLVPVSNDWFVANFVAIEFVVLSLSTYSERHTFFGWELKTHFAWESAVLALYVICGLAVWT